MKIINTDLNIYFALQQRKPFRGFATGTARVILGIAQCALNTIAIFFLVIPYKVGALKKYEWIDFNQFESDAKKGLLHIKRGFQEFFSKADVNRSDFWPYGRPNGYRKLNSDDPYSYEMTKCEATSVGHKCTKYGLHSSSGSLDHYVLDPL